MTNAKDDKDAKREREDRAEKAREEKTARMEAAAKDAEWPEKDPVTGLPLKTGNTLTDEHPPYGVPKDPETGEALPVAESKADAKEGEAPVDPLAPDPATLTAKEQNDYEVRTGIRVQKEASDVTPVARRAKPDQGLPGGRPAVPDHGLPGGPPKRPDHGLPEGGVAPKR